MRYSLWSRGRLLGESDFAYVRSSANVRMGDFHPTETGERLMPVVTGMSRAILEYSRTADESWRHAADGSEGDGDSSGDDQRLSTEYADVAAARDHFEALELELRREDGSVIETEWIGINDTEFLVELAGETDESGRIEDIEHDAAIIEEHFTAIERDGPVDFEDGDTVNLRYQIIAELVHPADIP